MAFADLPVVGMLKTRMRWLESRQKVLSENIANAETPGYRQRDLKQLDFPQLVAVGAKGERSFETTPDGNSVVLEDEMMKVAETQQDYQLATMLYGKSLALLKMAVKG